MISLSTLAVEYVYADITAASDPSALPVAFAFKTGTTKPVAADWISAQWTGRAVDVPAGTEATARILLGSTGTTLAAGTYNVWLRVVSSPETFVRQFDTLKVV